MFILRVPLFILVLVICNIVNFTRPIIWERKDALFHMPLLSGASMAVFSADLLLLLGIGILYVEVFKSTRSTDSTIIEHVFSMFVFIVFLIEFLVLKGFGNITFFTLMCFSLLDVVAGFTITIATSRRSIDQNVTPHL